MIVRSLALVLLLAAPAAAQPLGNPYDDPTLQPTPKPAGSPGQLANPYDDPPKVPAKDPKDPKKPTGPKPPPELGNPYDDPPPKVPAKDAKKPVKPAKPGAPADPYGPTTGPSDPYGPTTGPVPPTADKPNPYKPTPTTPTKPTAPTTGPTDPYGPSTADKPNPYKPATPTKPTTPTTGPTNPYGPSTADKPKPTAPTDPYGPSTADKPNPYKPATPPPKPTDPYATTKPTPAKPTDPYATTKPTPAKPTKPTTGPADPYGPSVGPGGPPPPIATGPIGPGPQPSHVVARVGIADVTAVQGLLAVQHLDGWLLTDRDGANPIAVRLVAPDGHPTRPWFYLIPSRGVPILLAHSAEIRSFDHLAGTKLTYQGYRDLDSQLKVVLKGIKSVAVEYSAKAAVPAVSRVDGGTLEVIRGAGVTVKSSDTLVQYTKAIWGDPGRTAHYVAAHHIVELRKEALAFVTKQLQSGAPITEYDVQQRLVHGMTMRGLVGSPPVVATGANTADPYYVPSAVKSSTIAKGDTLVISLAAKVDKAEGIYAVQTWVAIADATANPEVARAFAAVALARDQALGLIADRATKHRPITGAEVDQATRALFKKSGFADRVKHRTGHSIDSDLQGGGADLDDYEVKDSRIMTPGTGFAIGPGLYFAGQFGVRSETSVYLSPTGPEVTMPVQDELELLLKR